MRKFVLLLFVLLVPFCFSQEAVQDEAKTKAVTKVIEVMKIREQLVTGFKTSMGSMMQPMVQQMGLNAEQAKELEQIFIDWWKTDIDQDKMIKQFEMMYAESFTTEELEELVDFYQTPLGQKTIHLMPELNQKGMQVGMEAAQLKQGELMKRVQDFMARVDKEMKDAEPKADDE